MYRFKVSNNQLIKMGFYIGFGAWYGMEFAKAVDKVSSAVLSVLTAKKPEKAKEEENLHVVSD